MEFKKSSLALAVATALVGGNAYATVDMNASPVVPVKFASEINTASPVVLANAANALDLQVLVGYAMSIGETKYARFECSSNVRFDATSAVAVVDGDATLTPGAINGLATNVISFPIVNTGAVLPATATLTINGPRTISSTSNITCTYGLYDQASQAANGGTTGLINASSVSNAPYITFSPALIFRVDTVGVNTADVNATPLAFSKFTGALSTTLANVGGFTLNFDNTVRQTGGTVFDNLNLLLGGTSKLVFAGDYSARASAGVPVGYDTIAGNCATPPTTLTTITNTSGELVGNTAVTGKTLCYTVNGTAAIPVASYTVTLQAVAAGATYNVSNAGPLALGSIVHNGTTLQAPVVQYPAGFSGRIFLANSGATAAPYTTQFLPDVGTTVGPAGAQATGSIPAGKHILVDVSQIFTVTAGPPRGSLIVNVAAPPANIQGAYQLYNGATGTLTNSTMMTPNQ